MSNSIFTTDTKRGNRETRVVKEKEYVYDQSAPSCMREDVFIQKVKQVPQCPDPCDPCAGYNRGSGYSWLWTSLIVAIILGVGFWLIRPDWVLKKDACGNLLPGCCIDWLKLVIISIVATIIIYIVLWIIQVLVNGSRRGGGSWTSGWF